MTLTKDSFERIKNDVNGNPRYLIHYREVMPKCFENLPITERHKKTNKLMNQIGGRKSHGNCIIFQSYNLDETITSIQDLILSANAAFNNLDERRKYYDYERILLDASDNVGFEDYSYYNDLKTDRDKAEFIHGRFLSEYGWNLENHGEHKALTDWLQGLALNIPYMNCDILKIAGKENAPEKEQEKILNNYWSFMAMRLSGIFKYFELNKGE